MGVGKQIGGLSPKVARDYAKKTAIGASKGVMSTRKMRGSLEGLVKQKTAMIERAGSGYSNVGQMGKRYSRNTLKNTSANYGILSSGKPSHMHSSNTSFMGTKGSSVQRIIR